MKTGAFRDCLLNVLNTRRGNKLKSRYTDINKRIKKQARKDKRAYFEDMAAETEEAAKKGDIRTLYGVTRKLANDKTNNYQPIKVEI